MRFLTGPPPLPDTISFSSDLGNSQDLAGLGLGHASWKTMSQRQTQNIDLWSLFLPFEDLITDFTDFEPYCEFASLCSDSPFSCYLQRQVEKLICLSTCCIRRSSYLICRAHARVRFYLTFVSFMGFMFYTLNCS